MKNGFLTVWVLAAILFVLPSTAQAYIDPSTGSMVLQIVVGGLLATVAAVRLYWRRFASLIRGKTGTNSGEGGAP